MAWILDLDGVVWLAGVPIPGVADAVAALRADGDRVVFVTNNSSATLGEQEATLGRAGIPAAGDVITSAQAAIRLLEPGTTALVVGGPGIVEAAHARGVIPVEDGDADTVVVGFSRTFDYERLRRAHRAVDRGARLVATNDDPTYPTPEGPIPGGGALVAAVETATGVRAVVAGKPHPPMVELVRAMAGSEPHTVVGDRPSTDGCLARALGARWALVLSGVTARADLPVEPAADVVADDLPALVATVMAARPTQ